MLLDINCSTVVSIKVDLKFDDGSRKVETVGVGDLINVEFNYNGCRRSIEGKVIKVYAADVDPKKWYIIVDCAEDFESHQYKFCPMNILDIEMVQKKDAIKYIETTNDYTCIRGLRIVKGRLQFTQDGKNWYPIRINYEDVIKDEEGTEPYHHHHHCDCDDDIKDEITE